MPLVGEDVMTNLNTIGVMNMNRVTLAQVMDRYFAKVKFDSKLAKAIYKYQIAYLNSSKEYIEFYGSNLLGVHIVRFKESDVAKLFDDVLDIEYLLLSQDLKHVSAIDPEWKVASDVFNLTTMYLLHGFITSKLIDNATRERVLYDVALLFYYRCIAALISYNFKYQADPEIARLAYSNLSQKFLIKKLGTWGKVMDYRAKELVDPKGLHYKSLKDFTNDSSIVYAINDSQGRIRDLIKNYYAEFAKVHEAGERVLSTSSTYLDAEGEEQVKEKVKSVEGYVGYLKDVIIDEHGFIKSDLITIISRINANVSYRSLQNCLLWLHKNYSDTKYHSKINDFVEVSIIHGFHLIQYSLAPRNYRDYPAILTGLKNLLASSRSSDIELMKIRDMGDEITRLAYGHNVSDGLVIATRNSLVLYLVLRVLVGYKA